MQNTWSPIAAARQFRQAHLDPGIHERSEAWKRQGHLGGESEAVVGAETRGLKSGCLDLNHSPAISRLCDLDPVP